ncbi:MAG: hypothetical protein JXB06_12155 [Spirochaetales bacterium]|nr:hypothetical protein [Spirochaetales bacterium]
MRTIGTSAPLALTVVCIVCLLLGSCDSGSGERRLDVHETVISDHSAALNLSLSLSGERLYMVYPAVDALSLNLVSADIANDPLRPVLNDTTYLDRISYSPDIDDSFGRHLFVPGNRLSHILYLDRESEENSVLKWLSKTETEETWWIDSFPGLSEPLFALDEGNGALRVLVAEAAILSLRRLSREAQPTPLVQAEFPAGKLQLQGDVCVVQQEDYRALTAFDGLTKRLYFITLAEDSIEAVPVYTAGAIHFSTILDDRLLILIYESSQATITLLERAFQRDTKAPQPAFESIPVTLCEGTNSVFLASHRGKRLFLFDEQISDHRERATHQLSILYSGSSQSQCDKLTLIEQEAPIEGFDALKVGDVLYVLYMSGNTLTLLSLSLPSLVQDQDPAS